MRTPSLSIPAAAALFFTTVGIAAPAPAPVPLPVPETVGAGGQCERPTVYVDSAVKSGKQGPWLVSGARVDANAGGGGASFTKTYLVSTTYTITAGLSLEGDFEKIVTLGLGFDASFSIAHTTGSSVGATVICPSNPGYAQNVTWGLMYYDWSWTVTGNKFFPQGYDPLMRGCLSGYIADDRKGGNHSYTNVYPATQQGAQDGADAEVEFQCCTDSRGATMKGSPVCPNAS